MSITPIIAATMDPVSINLVVLLCIGLLAQWIGWKLKLPAILLLLLSGFILGPVTNIFDPAALLGDALFPLVSMAVAIILFEGGLTLNFRELKGSGSVIFRLVLIGCITTWLAAAALAYYLLNFDLLTAALLGALLSVTGPTVIGPMLRTIRPKGKVKQIAKWEGILIDPVGVLLAVFIFEALILGNVTAAPEVFLVGIAKTIGIASILTLIGTGLLLFLIRNKLLPEFLHNLFILALVLGSFILSNIVQEESGLVTVTLLGIALANQRVFVVNHILLFKENLRVLFISCLFIVLSARVNLETLNLLGWKSFVFLAALILLVRPLSVFVSTIFSSTKWSERLLLMLLAPRGIVSAALASIFTLRLTELGNPFAEQLLAITLLVILGTVIIYGFGTGPIATRLGLSQRNPQGILLVGAQKWARRLATALKASNIHVLLVDTNRFNIAQARKEGLHAECGNVLSDEFLEEIDLSEIGKAICITENNEVNAYAQQNLIEFIERTDIYYLNPESPTKADVEHAKPLDALFSAKTTYSTFAKAIGNERHFASYTVTEEQEISDVPLLQAPHALPLFRISEDGNIRVFTEKDQPSLHIGNTVIYLSLSEADAEPTEP